MLTNLNISHEVIRNSLENTLALRFGEILFEVTKETGGQVTLSMYNDEISLERPVVTMTLPQEEARAALKEWIGD